MMAKLPYGGFEFDNASSAPWLNLFAIAESLEKGEIIRPNLAYWLEKAIRHADKDGNKLLINLGLKSQRGGQEKFPDGWLIYGGLIYSYEQDGFKTEAALSMVHEKLGGEIERGTLQRWRDKYKKVLEESMSAHE